MHDFEQIIATLGEPFYRNEWTALYNMDCRQGLEAMRVKQVFVHSTITSPPYNIGKEYEKPLSTEEYIHWLSGVCSLIYDVTHPSGSYLLNLGYLPLEQTGRAVPIPYLLWDKIKFYLQQEIVWNYGAGVACKNYLSPRNEKILWYVKNAESYTFNLDAIRDPDVKYPNSKKNGRLRTNTLGKNPSDVWQIAKVTTGANRSSTERTPHPAQFPEDLVVRAVAGFTNAGEIILDPFLGSGTTAIVAMKHKRYSIGFEINEEYCHLIKKRVQQYEQECFSTTQALFEASENYS
ncbi:MAG: site-specific DNA-methyltransferase [Candidatus Kapabacteria bacterium]|jgi:adenine-specific DNA-methyltransferase|nr:site-specific DNA-methyltransferase [Candidatus Kapabacteria bacterium]